MGIYKVDLEKLGEFTQRDEEVNNKTSILTNMFKARHIDVRQYVSQMTDLAESPEEFFLICGQINVVIEPLRRDILGY